MALIAAIARHHNVVQDQVSEASEDNTVLRCYRYDETGYSIFPLELSQDSCDTLVDALYHHHGYGKLSRTILNSLRKRCRAEHESREEEAHL